MACSRAPAHRGVTCGAGAATICSRHAPLNLGMSDNTRQLLHITQSVARFFNVDATNATG